MAYTNLPGESLATPAPEQEKPKYQYRFTQNGAEWAVDNDGHYRVLSCGRIKLHGRVRLNIPGCTHRRGTVLALIPGYGRGPWGVLVAVQLDSTTSLRRRDIIEIVPGPLRVYPLGEVVPIRENRQEARE